MVHGTAIRTLNSLHVIQANNNPPSIIFKQVDVKFVAKMKNFVPLSLFKYLATQKEVPKELDYLSQEHLDAIKAMPLITRGRLSVQDVSQVSETSLSITPLRRHLRTASFIQSAYEATVLMGENGGFEGLVEVKTAKKPTKKRTAAPSDETPTAGGSGTSREGSTATSQASSARATRSAPAPDFVPPLQSHTDGSLSKRTRRL